MKISNRYLEIKLQDGKLNVQRLNSLDKVILEWPACTLSVNNQLITPDSAEKAIIENQSIRQKFNSGNICFEVILTLSDSCWFRKEVQVTRNTDLPTVDYIDVDTQNVADQLESCGYVPESQPDTLEERGEEEGAGFISGCGYPLIGKRFFTGLEHPAAFNVSNDGKQYYLRHYPQWNDNKLESVSAVFGWSDDAVAGFREYLNEIRLPALGKPMISFCSFWSDPYIGDYEYAVHYDNYMSFFKAFEKLDLKPDVFTLDAGWNDRQSIFAAKGDLEGDAGLEKLQKNIKEQGIDLSLWLSHNGPMGIAPEFLEANNMAVGKGIAAAYAIGKYGVMMDKKFEQELSSRFCQLIEEFNAVHFKIDWDNECASNSDFSGTHPTVNHVRQSSIDAMIRIARDMRNVKSDIITRNGWWTSPWWLCHADHVWLCDSGDSEYTSLPSKSQREAAATHRDALYYAVLQRDKSMIPLDCFDNHEFPDALRNPFIEKPAGWVNAIWLSFLRGSTYLAYTLQPEKLEDWQVKSLKSIIDFCRKYAENIFVKDGYMFGGCPSHGEIYGFMQPGTDRSWCIIRNPFPLPQSFKLTEEQIPHVVENVLQFYPCYNVFAPGEEITLPAHGIAILVWDSQKQQMPFEHEFMTIAEDGEYCNYFPSSLNIDDNIRPLVDKIYQVQKLEALDVKRISKDRKTTLTFKVRCPYRVRDFELQIGVKGPDAANSSAKVYFSRYEGATGSCCIMPMSEYHVNLPGCGEKKNQGLIAGSKQKYYAAKIADGGESYYRLIIDNVDFDSNEIELWLSGYEAPSRENLKSESAPFCFDKALPFQHPLGFPRQEKIEI